MEMDDTELHTISAAQRLAASLPRPVFLEQVATLRISLLNYGVSLYPILASASARSTWSKLKQEMWVFYVVHSSETGPSWTTVRVEISIPQTQCFAGQKKSGPREIWQVAVSLPNIQSGIEIGHSATFLSDWDIFPTTAELHGQQPAS